MESGRANVPNDVREIVPINLRVTCRHRFQLTTRARPRGSQIEAVPREFYGLDEAPVPDSIGTYLSGPNAARTITTCRPRADHFHRSDTPMRRFLPIVR